MPPVPRVSCMIRSFPSPEENLAFDQALFEDCEENRFAPDILRFWQPDSYFVVAGYTNRINTEVNIEACRETRTPILRRFSGGGTVVQGPGCLNYSRVFRGEHYPECETIAGTNVFVMKRHRDAIRSLVGEAVEFSGMSDLTLGNLKFSGNAQRRGRHAVLFHGTFLLSMDLALISRLLHPPSQAPAYRMGRSHAAFVTNINVEALAVINALEQCWNAQTIPDMDLAERVDDLVRTRYADPGWNFRY
jgi:lipoate-protein ligase A